MKILTVIKKIFKRPDFWCLAILFTAASVGMILDGNSAAGVLASVLDGGWIILKISEIFE